MQHDADDWWQHVHGAITQVSDEAALTHTLKECASSLGFPHCSYGIEFPVCLTSPTTEILDGYPSGWLQHYQAANYLDQDPSVHAGRRGATTIVWSDALFEASSQLWGDARAAGLRFGIAHPAWGPSASYGLLSLARDAEPISKAELVYLTPRLGWLAEITHQRLHALMCEPVRRSSQLSPRERDVLKWTAEGKTSWEVSQILHISERTVNYHVNSILRKLDSRNKVQAAVKAATLGILPS